MAGGYSHRWWTCPFYRRDERTPDGKDVIRCEAGRLDFPDREAAYDWTTRYCASPAPCWEECPLAKMMTAYYERTEKDASEGKDR